VAGAWTDYDTDGYPDLYVANEHGFSTLYRNRGDGTFEDVGEASGTRMRSAATSVAWGDFDGDGQMDLFVSGIYASSRWALFHPAFPAPSSWTLFGIFSSEEPSRSAKAIDRTRGAVLFRNEGNGRFTDVTDRAGVRDVGSGFGAEFIDYDNDGKLDLLAQSGAARVGGDGPMNGTAEDPSRSARKVLFRNNGDGTFSDVAYVDGLASTEDGRGLSLFDFDGDGRTDVLLRNHGGPTELLHNVGPRGGWMDFKLVGTISNRDAVGAKIRLRTRDGWQTRVVSAGSAHSSAQSLIQHFGLGADDRARELVIWWPSGATTRLVDLEGGHRFTVTENSKTPITCADPACEQP
jgi:hypothetical protein